MVQEKWLVTATHDKRSDAVHENRRGHPQPGAAAQRRRRYDPECRDDQQMVGMHQAFRATGGLLSLDEVRTLFQRYGGPDAAVLAGWIRMRAAIAFEWREEAWLPMFQFSRKALSVHQSLGPVLRELSAIYDGWETSNWFALPNPWLTERAPVDMLARDLSAVWYAARVDRFIALGEAKWEKQPLTGRHVDWRPDMLAMPAGRDIHPCRSR
jgi:hypothetical protein